MSVIRLQVAEWLFRTANVILIGLQTEPGTRGSVQLNPAHYELTGTEVAVVITQVRAKRRVEGESNQPSHTERLFE
eukprot:1190590-Prorocentrum_minimum.AAC.1